MYLVVELLVSFPGNYQRQKTYFHVNMGTGKLTVDHNIAYVIMNFIMIITVQIPADSCDVLYGGRTPPCLCSQNCFLWDGDQLLRFLRFIENRMFTFYEIHTCCAGQKEIVLLLNVIMSIFSPANLHSVVCPLQWSPCCINILEPYWNAPLNVT